MFKFCKKYGVILTLLCGFSTQAWSASAIDALRQFSQNTTSAVGQFSQSTKNVNGQVGQTQTGVFAFQRPGKFRWETLKPFAQLVIADGTHLIQYDPDLKQLTKRNVGSALGSSPAAILFGQASLEQSFELTELTDRQGMWVQAKPRQADAGFEAISIEFKNAVPVLVEVKDAFGQVTQIRLSQIKAGPVANSQFQFTAPADTEVVVME